MQSLFTIILTAFLLFLSWCYIKRRKYIKCLEKIPGPPPLPIIGNALDMASPKAILPKFLEYYEKYGALVKVHIGQIPNLLIINDYKFLEFLLSSTELIEKPPEYKFFSNWLGSGLSMAAGDLWKKHRKILTPTFHFKILDQFIEVFESNAKILIESLKNEVGKSSTNVSPIMKLCALDIICETAMGTSVNAQINSESEYVRSATELCKIITDRIFNPFLHYTILYIFTRHYRQEMKCLKYIHGYTKSVITKRKAELEDSEPTDTHSDIGIKKRLAFLDLILQERKTNKFSDKEIQDEVNTFMFAGLETTATMLSFAMYSLAENPKIQKAVVDELQEIFSDDKFRAATLKDLQSMKYLEAVIKETLRIYPSLPFYSRQLKEDIVYDGITLPKDLVLVMFAYGIHRNPELFPEPLKFLPERFLTDNIGKRLPFGYIPFSAGPRNCLGQKFAMLEMKLVLSAILRSYELLPAEPRHEPEITIEVTLASANGVCIRFVEREF